MAIRISLKFSKKSSEYQEARAEYRAAADELKLAALEVGRIRAQIGDRILKSPIDGVVTEIHKHPGEKCFRRANLNSPPSSASTN